MSLQRIAHDSSWALAQRLVEIIAPCLRDEERLDAHREFQQVCQRHIEHALQMYVREQQRLHPSQN